MNVQMYASLTNFVSICFMFQLHYWHKFRGWLDHTFDMYGNLIHRRAMEKFRPPTQANEILCSLARLNGTFYTSSFSFDGLYAIPSGNHVSQITTGEYQTRLFMPGSWRYKDQDISLRNRQYTLSDSY